MSSTHLNEHVVQRLARWKRVVISSSLLGAALCVTAETSHAEVEAPATKSEGRLEQLVVTARQREERLIDVPVAVSALDSADLERYGTTDLESISQLVPQTHISIEAGGTGVTVAIRGIRTPSQEPSLDQSVVFNVDGVPIGRGRPAIQGFFDLERAEVLKGPQALFFGKNASAGVISLTTKGPGDELEGYVRSGYEFNAHEGFVEGAIGGPLSDTFGARLAIRSRSMRGWVQDVAGPIDNPYYRPELNPVPGSLDPYYGEREIMGRLTLAFDPEGGFDATLKVSGNLYQDDGPSSMRELVHCGANGIPENSFFGIVAADPFGDCELNNRASVGHFPPAVTADWPYTKESGELVSNFQSILSSLTMNYETDNFTITSVTGITYYLQENSHAASPTVFSPILSSEAEEYTDISQEIRVLTAFESPLNFMAGAYYENSDLNSTQHLWIFRAPVDPATGKYQDYDRSAGYDGQTISLFGQIIWDVTDQIELTGGLRWTRETKDSFTYLTHVNPALLAVYLPVGKVLTDKFKDNNVSPEVTLTYHPTDDFMVYGAYKTGYKSGGAAFGSIPFASLTENSLPFESEKSEGFEVGWKLDSLINDLRLTGAAYHYIFSNLQVSAFDGQTASFQLENAAKATTTGVELDGVWAATQDLTLRGSVSYNRSRYEDFSGAPCYSGQTAALGCVGGVQSLAGKALAQAPRWEASLGFIYDRPIGNDGGLHVELTGNVTYTDSFNTDVTLPPPLRQSAFAKVDASIRVYREDGPWEIAIIGRNLTNKLTFATGSAASGSVGEFSVIGSRPREVGIQVTGRF